MTKENSNTLKRLLGSIHTSCLFFNRIFLCVSTNNSKNICLSTVQTFHYNLKFCINAFQLVQNILSCLIDSIELPIHLVHSIRVHVDSTLSATLLRHIHIQQQLIAMDELHLYKAIPFVRVSRRIVETRRIEFVIHLWSYKFEQKLAQVEDVVDEDERWRQGRLVKVFVGKRVALVFPHFVRLLIDGLVDVAEDSDEQGLDEDVHE